MIERPEPMILMFLPIVYFLKLGTNRQNTGDFVANFAIQLYKYIFFKISEFSDRIKNDVK